MVASKLRTLLVLSSLWLISLGAVVDAHEVTPTIGDLTVTDGQLELDLRLNIEAFVAGIDLDGLADTNASDRSNAYDRLRALPPQALEREVRDFAPGWLEWLRIDAAGQPVPLDVARVEVPEVGDVEQPRATHLVVTGQMPSEAGSLVLTWPDGAGDLVLRQQGVEEPFTGYLEGGQTTTEIPLAGGGMLTGWQVFAGYIPVGFDHILPKGLDHILFVLGLFFLSTRLMPLIWQVSAFTLAHTVTLALGALDIIRIPGEIVEPLIAASIVYVAVENIFTDGLNKWRPALVFAFGLLHGLGFASVLEEFGLPASQFLPALIGFNIGVELGQLTVIAIAFLLVGYWFGQKAWYRSRIAIPCSAVIAAIGAFWFIERIFLT
ncbi:HupE/UreJ family protein [Thalassococcus sp. S3]|uniref:HupE/UreJ family protein n=1 Tax=Thalassococcus sp. S3 TaxID=2017482 RepID=UPI0010247F88|nr:HupE/UreJ family protein [Thalassococcus sp. S3]QBF33161.1 hypothetical protein CFI11_18300 [Thalassococcus sp. S3]